MAYVQASVLYGAKLCMVCQVTALKAAERGGESDDGEFPEHQSVGRDGRERAY